MTSGMSRNQKMRAIAKADNEEQDYRMRHTAPGPDSAPFYDLEKDTAPDLYDHPEYYTTREPEYDKETISAIMAARGNPDAMVNVHRAGPVGQINTGDWVTTSHAYAKHHGMHAEDSLLDSPVWSTQVPASTLFWDGNCIHEYGYHGRRAGLMVMMKPP